ncbi:hypothetical protein KVV02_006584 [Mortierella alpina]|uniref:F-box domain-containing protein n=1 Tax=Mortierella alpina TaxID=64518 RepID=A0A9P8CXG8_MORAP|nr:hypothetical protein KVV02_006584 [Mortierella alpina]
MRDLPASLASLPPELLDRIAYFVPRASLTTCILVSKAWLACFRPILWQEIDLLDYARNDFVPQFQLYHRFIRSLSFSIPSTCPTIRSLFGIAAPHGAKTIANCTRLQSLHIAFDEDCYHLGELDHDLMADIIDQVVKANLSTLQQFKFSRMPYSIEDMTLLRIFSMTSLNSLSLEGWETLRGVKLLAVLQSRRSTLRTLSLEMNDMSMGVEPFEELQHWRAEVEGDVKGDGKGDGKTFEDELNKRLAASLTGITTLVLDRSTIDPITVTRLAGVMPDLRKLSLKGSFGLGMNMDHLQDEALNNPVNLQHVHNQNQVPTASDNTTNSEVNVLVEGASAGAEEIQEEASQQSDDENEEQEHENPTPASTYLVWNDIYDNVLDDADDDLGDAFDDYLGSGDEDFDDGHYGSLYHAGVATASINTNARTHQTRMLQLLHKLCPKIEAFDFTECRTEGVDNHFLLNVCQLWGPAGSASSGQQTSGGLKVLDAGDVHHVENSFFGAVLTHCRTTLTGLDLSWSEGTRHLFGTLMRPTGYYDEILNIMTSCPHLEYLHVELYPVNGQTIQLATADWVCTKLKSLKMCIGVDLSYSGDEDEVRIAVCKQLGRLVRLKTLHLESREPQPLIDRGRRSVNMAVRKGLYLSLATGLDHLAGLEDLESLDISRMVSHGLREEPEMDWIVDHWPALNHFVGLLDLDALFRSAQVITAKLGPPAAFMPVGTPGQGFARQNAMKRQRAGIPLPVEMDLQLNPLTKRLRDRGINVDPQVVDAVLREEQLHIVAKEDKNGTIICYRPNGGDDVLDEHGNKPPPQMFSWVVCYLPSVTQNWANARPGGRSNEEYMSYVMRPRGGRSPSPLGTWY